MTTQPIRRFALSALGLGLSGLLVACSSSDETLLSSSEGLRPAGAGRVALSLGTGGIAVDRLHYVLRDAAGAVLRDATIALEEAAARLELDVPVGSHSLALSAVGAGGVECSGEAIFDVIADATLQVPVELVCEASGRVTVTGSLFAPEDCPSVALAGLDSPVALGESVQLHAAAELAGDAGINYAWASSSGALEGALASTATFTCTEAGPVTLTLTASLAGCTDTASTVVQCANAEAAVCSSLGSNCHVVDPGSGPLHDCHELGHAGDEKACSAGRAGCVESCGTELCGLLGSFCHPVDPGSGPLHDCHELGHAGDPNACFERGRECYDLCSQARTAAAEPISIRFAARVGAEEFACGQTYEDVGASAVLAEPQDFRFFVSDVRLLDANGGETPVLLDTRAPWQGQDTALLDFEDQTGLCAGGTAAVNDVITGRVFPGEYVGIAFRLSVPESLNHDDPALASAPLELGTMSWGWLLGYRFLRAELAGIGDEATAPGLGLLHLGSTSCTGNPQAGTVVCTNENRNDVRLSGFDATSSVIIADIGALFANTDLSEDSQCHSAGEFCPGPFESAGVNLDTGAALETQTLFRLE
jgi:uncharacterized repeat protein (TIGR04052 family)